MGHAIIFPQREKNSSDEMRQWRVLSSVCVDECAFNVKGVRVGGQ